MANQEQINAKHQAELAKFRMLRQETTDPMATRLVSDIISDMEADASAMQTAADKPQR